LDESLDSDYTVTLDDIERYVRSLPPERRVSVCSAQECVVAQTLRAKYPALAAIFIGSLDFTAVELTHGSRLTCSRLIYNYLPIPVRELILVLGYEENYKFLPGPHRCKRHARIVLDVITALRAGVFATQLASIRACEPEEWEGNTEGNTEGDPA
jgi:hypothetical protein